MQVHCILMPDVQKTGREIILERLEFEIARSMTADLQRAAEFLKGARKVREGCKRQRRQSRINQKNAWKKKVDNSIVS